MTTAPDGPAPAAPPTTDGRRSGPLAGLAAVLVVGGALCWVLAVVRPWGDTSVSSAGVIGTGVPVAVPVLVGVALLAAAAAGVAAGRPVRGHPVLVRSTLGAVAVVAAGAGVAITAGVVSGQAFPRVGGWFALAAGVAAGLAGVAVLLDPALRPRGPGRIVLVALDVVLVAALAAVTVAVAPGWSSVRITARYDDTFSEGAVPVTVGRVGWTDDVGGDRHVVGVFDGYVVEGSMSGTTSDGCLFTLLAVDTRTGDVVWIVSRPVRCGAGGVTTVDGDDQVLRIGLGQAPRQYVYVSPLTGRELFPAAGDADVTDWVPGFGVVVPADGADLIGIVPTTGATAWRRPSPRCPQGRPSFGRQEPTAYRSPLDSQRPPGAVAVLQAGNRIVLGYDCRAATGGVTAHVLSVDVTGDGATDHDVTLPGPATGDTGFVGSVDLVFAVRGGDGATATTYGIDLGSGRLLWQRQGPGPITHIAVTTATGALVTTSGADASVVVADPRTGRELARWTDTAGAGPALELSGERVELAGNRVFLQGVDTGSELGTIDLAGCPGTPAAAPPLQVTPGSVLVRCTISGSPGAQRLMALVP